MTQRRRWLALFVENDVGVLAEISGLFAGKAYNLDSLTVGVTADETVSRMTVCLRSDDALFEQIKKQLNRNVNVIKVVDMTDDFYEKNELAYFRVNASGSDARDALADIVSRYGLRILDARTDGMLLQSVNSFERTGELVKELTRLDRAVEVVRGGSVVI